MAILIRKIKSLNSKKAFSLVFLAGLTAFLISSPMALANGPQFNIFPICYQSTTNCDLPMLDGRDVTRGEGWSSSQADHDAGVQANPGDILEFSVYYHNGVPDTDENVAINTIVQAFVQPSLGTPAMNHVISASIHAQNAGNVTSDSIARGGNINVQILGSLPQSLSLVPGSVVLFPNQGTFPVPAAQQMPDTVFSGGVNIGTVRGCFQYHGFVNFKLQVSQAQAGNLSIRKQVRNITESSQTNDTEVTATPGQNVEYRIVVSATNNPVTNVFVKDALDPKLIFANLIFVDSNAVANIGGFLTNAGYSIGTVTPGVDREIKFIATVPAASQLSVGVNILTNVATAFNSQTSVSDGANVRVTIQPQVVVCTYTWDAPLVADGSQRGSRRVGDQANVREQVSGLQPGQSFNQVNQHVSGSPIIRATHVANAQGNFDVMDHTVIPSDYISGDYNSFIEVNGINVAACRGFRIEPPVVQQMAVSKTVQNNNTQTTFNDQVDAQPSHRLTFQIAVSPQNSNAALQNVVLRDTLPSKLTFVSGSLNVNGSPQSEGNFFTSGLNLGTIQPGSQVIVTFQADVAGASSFTIGNCEILTNSATATASGNLTASDTALVNVCKQAPVKQPGSPGPRPF